MSYVSHRNIYDINKPVNYQTCETFMMPIYFVFLIFGFILPYEIDLKLFEMFMIDVREKSSSGALAIFL